MAILAARQETPYVHAGSLRYIEATIGLSDDRGRPYQAHPNVFSGSGREYRFSRNSWIRKPGRPGFESSVSGLPT